MTAPEPIRRTAVDELGLVVSSRHDGLHGVAHVLPTMLTPDTGSLRASVAASWTDTLLGLAAGLVLEPRIPVTLEIEVHLFDEIAGVDTIRATSRVVKPGRTVVVTSMDIVDGAGRLVGFTNATFMPAPGPELAPGLMEKLMTRFGTPAAPLAMPLAPRIGCERTGTGSASLPCTPLVHNGASAINGGLLTLVAEEAALSTETAPARIESVHMRYLRSVHTGPAVAQADVHHGFGRVAIRDADTNALAAIATTRSRAV